MATLKHYLPNVTDPAARESLLMQVLYTANSLGRLGADFSLMIAMLDEDEDEDEDDEVEIETQTQTGTVTEAETTGAEQRVAEGGSDGESNGQDGGLRQQQQARDDDDDDDDNNNNYNNYNGEVEDEDRKEETEKEPQLQPQQQQQLPEPEWISVIKKHRVQAARLEALAAGQDRDVQRRESSDIAVR